MQLRTAFLILVSLMVTASGCRTTDKDETSKVQSAKAPPKEVVGGPLEFSVDESQKLYLQMLEVELASGVKVSREYLHTSRGVTQCHKDGVLETCFLRVRVIGDRLSATQPLSKELTARTFAYVRKNRPDLSNTKLVLTDLTCDYIGKKSPPYDVESVRCHLDHPRATNEAIFSGRAAEEMAESIRGGIEFSNKKVTLVGTVACQWIAGSSRSICMTRAVDKGVLQEQITELKAHVSGPVSKRLREALRDHFELEKPSKAAGYEEPQEIMGSLNCTVDSLDFETTHQRRYLCRVVL